jgi:hypothetical protein
MTWIYGDTSKAMLFNRGSVVTVYDLNTILPY